MERILSAKQRDAGADVRVLAADGVLMPVANVRISWGNVRRSFPGSSLGPWQLDYVVGVGNEQLDGLRLHCRR